jgi:hypothetical protein
VNTKTEYCARCHGPHHRNRCRDCHALGRQYSMGRNAWGLRWHHDATCRYYVPRRYPDAEQEKHREAFGGKPWGDGYCPVTDEYSFECQHCWDAADRDNYGWMDDANA